MCVGLFDTRLGFQNEAKQDLSSPLKPSWLEMSPTANATTEPTDRTSLRVPPTPNQPVKPKRQHNYQSSQLRSSADQLCKQQVRMAKKQGFLGICVFRDQMIGCAKIGDPTNRCFSVDSSFLSYLSDFVFFGSKARWSGWIPQPCLKPPGFF